jgi:D-alanyl-D-alanine carboxypeptidase
MNDSRLLALERELRRRKRATARLRRRRRRRTLHALAVALGVAALAAVTVGTGLFELGRGGGSEGARSQDGVRVVGGGARAPAQAGGSAGGALSLRTAHSPAGLPLGRPPLTLTPAPAGRQVLAPFHHPPHAGLLFDLHSGRVLWARDATRVLPIASLTKMMTALLVVRSRRAGEPVPIGKRAVDAQGSKIGLLPLHRHVRLETLLYGLLLPSGNDAAVALAEDVAGSLHAFVARMNDEAARLGLACTRYTSPDGLDNGNSSCAADLAELASVDLAQPRVARVARSASAVLPFPIKGGKLYLYNNNPLLRYGYPGATGLKTGETEAAGLCLVGTAERDGVRLGVVLLHSPELGRQAEFLLDRGFEAYGQRPLPAPPVPPGR